MLLVFVDVCCLLWAACCAGCCLVFVGVGCVLQVFGVCCMLLRFVFCWLVVGVCCLLMLCGVAAGGSLLCVVLCRVSVVITWFVAAVCRWLLFVVVADVRCCSLFVIR